MAAGGGVRWLCMLVGYGGGVGEKSLHPIPNPTRFHTRNSRVVAAVRRGCDMRARVRESSQGLPSSHRSTVSAPSLSRFECSARAHLLAAKSRR